MNIYFLLCVFTCVIVCCSVCNEVAVERGKRVGEHWDAVDWVDDRGSDDSMGLER